MNLYTKEQVASLEEHTFAYLLVEQKEHVALVVDEYGSVSGVVSMEDVIETLLGLEIMDESDEDSNMQELARKNWETRARRMGLLDDKKAE